MREHIHELAFVNGTFKGFISGRENARIDLFEGAIHVSALKECLFDDPVGVSDARVVDGLHFDQSGALLSEGGNRDDGSAEISGTAFVLPTNFVLIGIVFEVGWQGVHQLFDAGGNCALWFRVHDSDIVGAIASSAGRPEDITVINGRGNFMREFRLAQVLGDQGFTGFSPSILVFSTDSNCNLFRLLMVGIVSQPLVGDLAVKLVTTLATALFVLDPSVFIGMLHFDIVIFHD